MIGGNKPIYTIERMITNLNEPFDDGELIIYVNGADRNSETELGRLMHDFSCMSADEMHYSILAEKVRYFKETEKGVATMCKAMEDMRDAVRIENAKKMLADGVSVEKNSRIFGPATGKGTGNSRPETVVNGLFRFGVSILF